ncbi:MAG: hypothetical protein AAGB29_03035, partial [Planctomycetota bacterium]
LDTALREAQEGRQQIERDRADLERKHREADEIRATIDEQRAQLAERRGKIETDRADLMLREEAAAAQQQRVDEWRRQVAEEMAGIAAAAEDAEDTQQTAAALAERQRKLDARQAELNDQAAETDRARGELEALRQQLADRGTELDGLTEALDHRTAELDDRTAQLELQAEQLDARAQGLAEQAQSTDDQADSADELHRQIEELTQRVRDLEPLEAQAAEANDRAEALQARLDEAERKLESLSTRGDTVVGFDGDDTLAGSGTFNDAEREAYESQITELRDELAAAKAAASMAGNADGGNVDDALRSRAEELDRRAAELEAKQQKYRETLAQSKEMIAAEKQAVRQQQSEVENASAQVTEERERLRVKKQKLIQADEYLKGRRVKLTRYRKLLRKRSMAVKNSQIQADSAGAQYQGLEKERQMLIEVKKFLESSEAEMARRWSTGKAAGNVATLFLALAAIVTVSWFASIEVAKPVWSATIGFEIDADAAPGGNWAQTQRQTLLTEAVLTDTVHRLRREGITEHGGADALRARLEQDMTVTGQPPALTVELATTDRTAAPQLLDALGRAFLGHQMSLDRAEGRADSTTIATPATVGSTPIENDQLELFGIIAGSAAGAMLVLFLLAKVILARSKRVFDDTAPELDALEQPEGWSPATNDRDAA